MFNLIAVAFIGILGMIGITFSNEVVYYAGIALSCISLLWFFASFINTFIGYSDQTRRFETLRSKMKKIEKYNDLSSQLTDTLQVHLTINYPAYEKEILKSLAGGSAPLMYPELKGSETISQFASQIVNISRDRRDMENSIEDLCSEIRYYRGGKWEYFKPVLPQDIKALI